jgi:hypothetical protein
MNLRFLLIISLLVMPVVVLPNFMLFAQSNGAEMLSSHLSTIYKHNKSPNRTLINILANKQVGIPYKAGLLDRGEEEQLICRLDSTDCVLFVENVLASVLSIPFLDEEEKVASRIEEHLAYLRYGKASDVSYIDRMHYVSEWMRFHTQGRYALFELPFQAYTVLPSLDRVNFMSKNASLYARIQDDQDIERVREMERRVNNGYPIRYISKDVILNYLTALEDGDIIGFVSTIDGLDVSHTAFISKDPAMEPNLSFYHASLKNGVERYADGLVHYLRSQKRIDGIVVMRLKNDLDRDVIEERIEWASSQE